ncbi:hypothetical protein NDU88_002681 [Pleurodeles waltl]|uniref:Uncharacterized protein n=1 Tax=Pleurodeles waltl TaxID=8319 RepID=A0AAV7KSU1_PLEWA|nr:hypothetical protein NDU88_002681 [Pleurodeles waltl]
MSPWCSPASPTLVKAPRRAAGPREIAETSGTSRRRWRQAGAQPGDAHPSGGIEKGRLTQQNQGGLNFGDVAASVPCDKQIKKVRRGKQLRRDLHAALARPCETRDTKAPFRCPWGKKARTTTRGLEQQ